MAEVYNGMKYGDLERPSIRDVIDALQGLIPDQSRLFVVVDALDECLPTHRTTFLSEIFKLQAKHHINLLATSNFDHEIAMLFDNATSLEIRTDHDDLRLYLGHLIDQGPYMNSFVSNRPDLRKEAITSIVKNSGGRSDLSYHLHLHFSILLIYSQISFGPVSSPIAQWEEVPRDGPKGSFAPGVT
jgi:hypothetical protein